MPSPFIHIHFITHAVIQQCKEIIWNRLFIPSPLVVFKMLSVAEKCLIIPFCASMLTNGNYIKDYKVSFVFSLVFNWWLMLNYYYKMTVTKSQNPLLTTCKVV